jgi:hypothetical protein
VTAADLYAITYGNGTFLVTGSGCTLLSSIDGAHWDTHNSGTIEQLFGVGFGKNTFVLTSSGSAILQSGLVGPLLNAVPGFVNGTFGMSLSASLGGQWELQASTDLVNWTALGTVTITNTPMPLIDSAATNFARRFYRAVSR